MKKYLILSIVAMLFAGFAEAQKASFVPEKQIMKIQKGAKDAVWPKSELILSEDLAAASCRAGTWKVENKELSNEGTDPLVIQNLKGDFAITFEYKFDSNEDEGALFICAANNDPDKALRIKLSNVNAARSEDSIGSINGKVAPKNKFDESNGRWIKMFLFVEGDSIRLSSGDSICMHYADRNFLTTSFDEISKKLGQEIDRKGGVGFVCNKGKIKIKNLSVTKF